MSTKKCAGCKKSFPKSEFKSSNAKGVFYRSTCLGCRTIARNKKKSGSPEAYLKSLYHHLKYSRTKNNKDVNNTTPLTNLVSFEYKSSICFLNCDLK